MPISGKYDFKGIKKIGAVGLKAALLSTPGFAWLSKIPSLSDLVAEYLCNWLANKSLIVMNISAAYVNGEIDQKLLDRAIEAGIKSMEISGGNLTPEKIKEIDDAVIKAADKALVYGKLKPPTT